MLLALISGLRVRRFLAPPIHVLVTRQFSHDLDVNLLMLDLYRGTEIIRGDMVLLGTREIYSQLCRTTHSTRTAYIAKVGKCIAKGK